jgi:sugar phosphate isomerase/epimerase
MSDMNLSRRGFLGVAAGAGIGVAAGSMIGPMAGTASAAMGVAAPNTPHPNLGLQMYSVRDRVSAIGFAATFEELARIGFKEIEFAGYTQGNVGAITVGQLRTLLDDNGLKAVGAHQNLGNVLGVNGAAAQQREFEQAVTLGMKHVGSGSLFTGPSNTVADIQAIAERYNKAGEVAATYGLKVYGHNHNSEFAFTTDNPSRRKYDVLVESINHPNVALEMDIYWAYVGAAQFPGFNPPDYVVARPELFSLFHTKDGNVRPGGTGSQITEFGAGNVEFRAFFNAVGAKAYHHPLWEQDNASSTPAALGGTFGAALRSYNNMHAMRTLTWLDELGRMIDGYVDGGRLNSRVAANLHDRLSRALSLVEDGSETRAQGYIEQLIARANNQIKGDADDALVRSLIVSAAQHIHDWLGEAEGRENEL